MSVEMEPNGVARPRLSRPIAEIAKHMRVDSRIPAIVPGFDAPFFQAGLAGYSDGAMRLVARRHGCPYCITEALLDRTLINGGKGRRKEDPDLLASECGLGDPHENRLAGLDDHPIAGQLMGTMPDEMARAADLMVAMNYDVIDVNLACPVKKIKKHNRGGHFLSAPEDAVAVLKAVREAVPSSIPTTFKIRRAWDDSLEMSKHLERIFNAAYEIGYAWATVHCRTVEQKYKGPGKWEFLSSVVARHPDKIIFGSGDIWSVEDVFAMLDVTGVHAVSVARGCIGNPWIFRQARQMMAGLEPVAPSIEEQRTALLEHFKLSVSLHGEKAASRMMRKFGIKFARHHSCAEDVKSHFIKCKSIADWHGVIKEFYQATEPITLQSPGSVTMLSK